MGGEIGVESEPGRQHVLVHRPRRAASALGTTP